MTTINHSGSKSADRSVLIDGISTRLIDLYRNYSKEVKDATPADQTRLLVVLSTIGYANLFKDRGVDRNLAMRYAVRHTNSVAYREKGLLFPNLDKITHNAATQLVDDWDMAINTAYMYVNYRNPYSRKLHYAPREDATQYVAVINAMLEACRTHIRKYYADSLNTYFATLRKNSGSRTSNNTKNGFSEQQKNVDVRALFTQVTGSSIEARFDNGISEVYRKSEPRLIWTPELVAYHSNEIVSSLGEILKRLGKDGFEEASKVLIMLSDRPNMDIFSTAPFVAHDLADIARAAPKEFGSVLTMVRAKFKDSGPEAAVSELHNQAASKVRAAEEAKARIIKEKRTKSPSDFLR